MPLSWGEQRTRRHEMGKQVTKVKPTTKALATPMAAGGFFSAPTAEDIIIPKILPLHYMSEKVKDKSIEASAGDLRDTLSNEKFGDTETPCEFIPLGIKKSWTIHKKAGNEFIEKIAWTPANQHWEREEGDVIRYLTYEVYVLIPKKIAEGGLPYVLSFRSTSIQAGKMLASKQFELAQKGLSLWDYAFNLTVKETSNDKGDFFVQKVTPIRKTTATEKAEAMKWFNMMTNPTANIKVDDSDLEKQTSFDMGSVETDQF